MLVEVDMISLLMRRPCSKNSKNSSQNFYLQRFSLYCQQLHSNTTLNSYKYWSKRRINDY